VYKEIDLTTIFEAYEAESYDKINKLINEIPEGGADGLKREVFQSFLAKVYKRKM
jgi:farnesyl diphosphate synthase